MQESLLLPDFDNFNDNQIVSMAAKGDEDALSYLFAKFLPAIKFKAGKFFENGLECDDFIQEGMLGLFYAILHFDHDNDASFKTFANLCIERRMISAYKTASCNKHMPLNYFVSIDSDNSVEEVSSASSNPELIFIAKENLDRIEQFTISNLSEFERLSFHYFLEDYSYDEIASKIGSTAKSVDNALQRVRKKLKDFF